MTYGKINEIATHADLRYHVVSMLLQHGTYCGLMLVRGLGSGEIMGCAEIPFFAKSRYPFKVFTPQGVLGVT
jgi:hypothetical protein